jgi:hypothetical protein
VTTRSYAIGQCCASPASMIQKVSTPIVARHNAPTPQSHPPCQASRARAARPAGATYRQGPPQRSQRPSQRRCASSARLWQREGVTFSHEHTPRESLETSAWITRISIRGKEASPGGRARDRAATGRRGAGEGPFNHHGQQAAGEHPTDLLRLTA